MLSRRRHLSVSVTVAFIAIIIACDLFRLVACNIAVLEDERGCSPSSCGSLLDIRHPFRLKDDPRTNCGERRYELSCENNRTVLYLYSGKYYVEAISYNNRTIRLVDPGVEKDNCSSMPLYSLTNYNFSNKDPYSLSLRSDSPSIIFTKCALPLRVVSSNFAYLNTDPCIKGSATSSQTHSYVLVGLMELKDIQDSCSIGRMVPSRFKNSAEVGKRSFSDIHHELVLGFQLSWSSRRNNPFESLASFLDYYRGAVKGVLYLVIIIVYITIIRTFFAIICLCPFVIYKQRRRHLSMDYNIEEFLQGHNNLVPIRYSYSDIKIMTKRFSDKLGQGGFGSVFKGKLRSGHLVAVKMLAASKGNGQDFINEVATIGRIHHVNVVQLIGFCSEGLKRALVYEFMPNGSLDKYIFPREDESISLTWEQMYKIALGVAHGIEYLHQGCDMQILHFDIKPYNILLDENFTPKISDFGLAKLYPVDDSIVSLTAARGTIGYIAPELFYKKIGGVSYKADVYSFGMLLMEMAGRRKNLNPHADNSSEIYFPSWIYERLDQGENMEMGDATEDENKIAKKMIIVALWCIQMRPVDRPSMSKVIEMLQSTVELLQMPPKPFLSSFERVVEDPITEVLSTICQSSSLSCYSMDSVI